MNEVLSNTEIEALLDMFRAEEAHIEEPREEDFKRVAGADVEPVGPVVSRVDLFKPNRLSREHMASLERCGDSAARAIGATTSEKLRLDMNCDCVQVEQLRFGSWLSQLRDSVAIYTLRMPPLEHTALLSISTGLLYAAVDRILGGTGRVADVPSELTSAEYTVADAFVGPCLDHVCKSLELLGDIQWEIDERLSNPSSAQVLGSHEVAVSLYFQVSGESMMGDMRLLLPYAMLESHLDKLSRSRAGGFNLEPGHLRDTVESSMREVDLDLRVCLGEASLAIRDLMALGVGDVVPLNTRVGDSLVAPVAGVPKFNGTVGTRGRRLAFCVQSMIS